jgi:hypothetical protein
LPPAGFGDRLGTGASEVAKSSRSLVEVIDGRCQCHRFCCWFSCYSWIARATSLHFFNFLDGHTVRNRPLGSSLAPWWLGRSVECAGAVQGSARPPLAACRGAPRPAPNREATPSPRRRQRRRTHPVDRVPTLRPCNARPYCPLQSHGQSCPGKERADFLCG